MSGGIKLNIYTADCIKKDLFQKRKEQKPMQQSLNLFQFPQNKEELYKGFVEGQKDFKEKNPQINKRDAIEAISEYLIEKDYNDNFDIGSLTENNLFSNDNFFLKKSYQEYYDSLDFLKDFDEETTGISFLSMTALTREGKNEQGEVLYLPYFEDSAA